MAAITDTMDVCILFTSTVYFNVSELAAVRFIAFVYFRTSMAKTDLRYLDCERNKPSLITLTETIANLCGRCHQHGARGHQVARKDHVGRPRACFENGIKI